MVKAVIYEVQTTKKEGSAIDLAFSILSGKFGLNLAGSADKASGAYAKFDTKGFTIDAVFSALSSDDRFKVMSSPRVRVRSGSSARFAVGDETPVLGSVSYDNNGNAVQSVSYKSSGVIFDFKPQVREAGVDLHLSQQLSTFIQTTTGANGTLSLVGDLRFLIQVVIFGPYFYACYRGLVYARRVYLGHERFRGRWYDPDELRRLKQEISDRFR